MSHPGRPCLESPGPWWGESALHSPCRLSTMVFPQWLGQQVLVVVLRRENHTDTCWLLPMLSGGPDLATKARWKPGCRAHPTMGLVSCSGHWTSWLHLMSSHCSCPWGLRLVSRLCLLCRARPWHCSLLLQPHRRPSAGAPDTFLRSSSSLISHEVTEFPPGTLRYSNYIDWKS